MPLKIECVDKLGVFLKKKKRIKILVGGRASTKSTFVADVVLSKVSTGETWCCGREFQNSIDDSVHSMLIDEVERCELPGFSPTKTDIPHLSGGKIFYKGLARNIASLKGLNRCKGLWIEEGETLSDDTLKVLTASIRLSAAEAKKLRLAGKLLEVPEIWITMNRGSRKDPVSVKFLERAEPELARCGYYEDDTIMVMQINYTDIPKQWFLDSGLEQERADDELHMGKDEYRSKWLGEYYDNVENAIIKGEWFDACVDAHKKLGFEASGSARLSYDPADSGDAKAIALAKGVVFEDIQQTSDGRIDTATAWALQIANDNRVDEFIYDADGIGGGLADQIKRGLNPNITSITPYKGGASPDNAEGYYDNNKAKKNKDMFGNRRAQVGWLLRDRMFKTWQAVVHGKYHDPDELISLSSNIKDLPALRAEVCRIPRIYTNSGKIRLMTKQEMKTKLKLESPNMYDALTYHMIHNKAVEPYSITYEGWYG